MDNSGKAKQPYRSPVLKPLGTLTELTQAFCKSGPSDNGQAPYVAEFEQPGTGGSGADF